MLMHRLPEESEEVGTYDAFKCPVLWPVTMLLYVEITALQLIIYFRVTDKIRY